MSWHLSPVRGSSRASPVPMGQGSNAPGGHVESVSRAVAAQMCECVHVGAGGGQSVF